MYNQNKKLAESKKKIMQNESGRIQDLMVISCNIFWLVKEETAKLMFIPSQKLCNVIFSERFDLYYRPFFFLKSILSWSNCMIYSWFTHQLGLVSVQRCAVAVGTGVPEMLRCQQGPGANIERKRQYKAKHKTV